MLYKIEVNFKVAFFKKNETFFFRETGDHCFCKKKSVNKIVVLTKKVDGTEMWSFSSAATAAAMLHTI